MAAWATVNNDEYLGFGYVRFYLPAIRISHIANIVVKYIQTFRYEAKNIIGSSDLSKVIFGWKWDDEFESAQQVSMKIMHIPILNTKGNETTVLSSNICF